MRLLPALLVLAAAWPWARAGERGLRPRDPSVALPWPLGARAPRTPPRLRPGRWGGAGGGSGEAGAERRGRPGAAGAGQRVQSVCATAVCGARGPRPGAVRVRGKDASLSRRGARLRFSPFLVFLRLRGSLSVPRGLSAWWLPPARGKDNKLGAVGPGHPRFPPWVPCPRTLPASFTSRTV
ncbi:hypothetical protein J1605_009022 [Eschrichtius robustus]|uniref:Uncharacterized protein n=1 Tax=Eschrichtius robustus TaxID=9764 RepID=A0AB34GZZ4_ESCRO|nr:hypothetical protein J1605_009022 [Eschrichtius robustus]